MGLQSKLGGLLSKSISVADLPLRHQRSQQLSALSPLLVLFFRVALPTREPVFICSMNEPRLFLQQSSASSPLNLVPTPPSFHRLTSKDPSSSDSGRSRRYGRPDVGHQCRLRRASAAPVGVQLRRRRNIVDVCVPRTVVLEFHRTK